MSYKNINTFIKMNVVLVLKYSKVKNIITYLQSPSKGKMGPAGRAMTLLTGSEVVAGTIVAVAVVEKYHHLLL